MFFLHKLIIIDIILVSLHTQNINHVKLYSNSLLPKTKQSKLNSLNDRYIKHPCYLKGYHNEFKKIIGIGMFFQCYDLVTDYSQKFYINYTKLFAHYNKGKIYLTDSFEEIFYIFDEMKRVPYYLFKQTTLYYCNMKYEDFLLIDENNKKRSNICFKLTYSLMLIDSYIKKNNVNDDEILIIFSENENISNVFLYIEIVLIMIYSSMIIKKKYLSYYIRLVLFDKETKNDKGYDKKRILSTFLSLPVITYLFQNEKTKEYIKEINKETRITYTVYYTIITELSKSDKLLKEKIKTTFLIQQNIKATILFHFLLIFISQINAIITLYIFSFLDFKYLNIILFVISIVFSLLTLTHIVDIFSFQEDLNAFSSLKSNLYRDSCIYNKDKDKKTIYIY